jgi:serine/threonine-protein kinase
VPACRVGVRLQDLAMTLDCVDHFLSVLRQTQLLAPEQVDEVARELVPYYRDPSSLGEYLVSIDWLTAYQLRLLQAGHLDELTVGPYQVLDRLGEGGVSEVFKAWDTRHGRVVALKVLRQHLADSRDREQSLQREREAITRLAHANIIRTYDALQVGDVCCLAMEFVEGMDLARFVAAVGPLCVELACDLARQAAQGLQHAHQLGLVHRDIKPANLFVVHPPLPGPARRPDPVVKIIDWGLARCAGEPAGHDSGAEPGRLVGTADFIAPEQARDPALVDIRSDIYSLGCTLYFLLTGQSPFPAGSLLQKVLQHQEAAPPSLQAVRPDVPAELDAVVRKMLAKDPDERFAIPLLLVTPLRRFCGNTAPTSSLLRAPGSHQGNGYRPGSAPAPGTAINLPRPATQTSLPRPSANGDHRGR